MSKLKNKKLGSAIVLGIVGFSLLSNSVMAYEEKTVESTQKVMENAPFYIGEHIQLIKNAIETKDFSKIDEKIKGYQNDINYLMENSTSEHYKNIPIYKEKLESLMKLKDEIKSVEDVTKLMEKYKVPEKWNELKKEGEKLGKETRKNVKEFIGNVSNDKMRSEIDKFKEKFNKQIGAKLDTLSEDKLLLVSGNIKSQIEKIKTMNISQEKKQNILNQLNALKEIVDEKLTLANEIDIFKIIGE